MKQRLPPRRLGAVPPAAYTQAVSDFQNQFVAVVQAGDQYLAANEAAQALTTYQAAGAAGVGSLGPEIDLLGYASATQPWTQKAWALNAYLAAATDATQAQAYARNMQLFYQTALQAALDQINGVNKPLPMIAGSQVALAAIFAAGITGAIVYLRDAQ